MIEQNRTQNFLATRCTVFFVFALFVVHTHPTPLYSFDTLILYLSIRVATNTKLFPSLLM
jgi:hypothetical protein